MIDPDKNSHAVELGKVFEQSKANAEQLAALKSDLSSSIHDLRKSIERMGDRLTAATAPNFSTMAAWAGVVLSIVFAMGGLVGFFGVREWDRFESQVKELDIKLQTEFQLALQTQKEGLDSANRASIERNHGTAARVLMLEEWIQGQVKSDLDELRQRRMKPTQ